MRVLELGLGSGFTLMSALKSDTIVLKEHCGPYNGYADSTIVRALTNLLRRFVLSILPPNLSYGNLSPAQLAYLAGIIDGEGCIRAKQYPGRDPWYPYVSVKMRTSEPLHTIGQWLNIHPYLRKDRPFWVMEWFGKRASELLPAILPYLILKQNQAVLAIELGTLNVGYGKANDHHRYRKGEVRTPAHILARMQEIRDLLREAKHAGA